MTTLHLKQSIDRLPLRLGFPLIALVLVCFVLAPAPNAFGVSPAPDGGYPNFNTAEGQNALFSLTTGDRNTANGSQVLYHNTTGFQNTATGVQALYNNTTINGITGNYNTANGSQAAVGCSAWLDGLV